MSLTERQSRTRKTQPPPSQFCGSKVVDLEVLLASELLILHNLDPIVVGVQQESDVLHAAVSETLLPVALQVLEAGAGGIDVVDSDA